MNPLPLITEKIAILGDFAIKYSALSNTGCVRSHNEDNYGVFPENNLFCLADGVGGLDAGEVASKELINSVSASLETHKRKKQSLSGKFIALFRGKSFMNIKIGQLIKAANQNIYRRGQISHKRMASTVVIMQAQGEDLIVAHVGDSRAYLLRNQILGQLTTDHTVFMELMLSGIPIDTTITPISNHVITKAMGSKPDVSPDEIRLKWSVNDIFLLCSDGLTDMIDDGKICHILQNHFPSMQKITQELINAAKAAGGRDNITVIVGHIGEYNTLP